MLTAALWGRCDEAGENVAVLNLTCHPRLFGHLTLVEIRPLKSERSIMQGDIITDVACRARVSVFEVQFVCCQKVESKEALQLRGWDAKLVQEIVLPMQDG